VPVPGTFELTLGAQYCFEEAACDAVICIGCVIQGETRHFDFICQGVTKGITDVMIKYHRPLAFGVLTTENLQQAIDRSGGKHGNKGTEAAYTVMEMLRRKTQLRNGELFKSK
jgi:6,7-dimethyl-8-ribityllumazine synthase